MPNKSAKNWCFTLNNYGESDVEAIERFIKDECCYGCFGKECSKSGTRHLQGYVVFPRRVSFNIVKAGLVDKSHIEVSRGTHVQNRRYCSKDGDFSEFGSLPERSHKGESRDELAVKFRESVVKGRLGVDEFAMQNPGCYIFYGSTMWRNYLESMPCIERPDINVQWFYGAPGVGKSRRAHMELRDAYIKDPRTKWWNGYHLEKTVIIDDFGPNGIDINHLLRWFDRYKCCVETKGGMVALYADTFIVTSNFHPRDIFKSVVYQCDNYVSKSTEEAHPQLDALLRRIVLVEF